MNANLYTLKCITNLHVGSGDTNFNIIDNEVEKDPITGYPIIFSSGVKGALRMHFESCASKEVSQIFGKRLEGDTPSTPGALKFMDANLLSIPMRASKGKWAYYRVTSLSLLKRFMTLTGLSQEIKDGFNELSKALSRLEAQKAYKLAPKDEAVGVEGIEISNTLDQEKDLKKILSQLIGENVVILPDEDFRTISLPVLARNYLENGRSSNLWYEEIVPHESLFYFYVLSNGTEEGNGLLNNFNTTLENNKLVQFGGNATIGCGLSQVERVEIE